MSRMAQYWNHLVKNSAGNSDSYLWRVPALRCCCGTMLCFITSSWMCCCALIGWRDCLLVWRKEWFRIYWNAFAWNKRHTFINHGRVQVKRVTRTHRAATLTECNRSRLASLKFPFAVILALSLFCDDSYVTINGKFSWELSHCYVTYATEQWYRQLVLCVLGSFILTQVTGQFFVRLKLFSNGNCPLDWN